MRQYKTIISALLLTVFAGCRTDSLRPTDPEPRPGQSIIAGTLEAQVNKATKSLVLKNGTEFVVGYLVVEKDIATVALFPPCGANCTKLVQGQSRTINFSEIVGYTPQATEARVMWWTYAPGSDQPQGGVQTVQVKLD